MSRDAIFQALTIAALLGLVKFIREVVVLQTQVKPMVEWWQKTSIDALRLATNPISERLTELGQKYKQHVTEGQPMSIQEKQELIDGLRAILNDPNQYESKRASASMSLRFIETREGLTARNH